jgi:hypothetical protein
VAVVEWADRLGDRFPAERLDQTLQPEPEGSDERRISWRAIGAAHLSLAGDALVRP